MMFIVLVVAKTGRETTHITLGPKKWGHPNWRFGNENQHPGRLFTQTVERNTYVLDYRTLPQAGGTAGVNGESCLQC